MSTNITNSRLCNYGCGMQIYWNSGKKAFVEVETGNKHFCQSTTASRTKPTSMSGSNEPNINRPTYYNAGTGKPWNLKQQKQPTKNSIQVLKGTELEVQKQYETLADIVTELGGRIHGSQSHFVNNSELRIIVYYEVPASGSANAENRELVKSRFNGN